MGRKTRADLITQAGLAAGNEQAASYARLWLDDWLQRTAKTWPWPQLKRQVKDVPAAENAAEILVGLGNGGTAATFHVHRLLSGFIFWYVPTAYSPRGRAFVRPFDDANPDRSPDATLATNRRGLPDTIKVRTGDGSANYDGVIRLYPDPVPDRALYLSMDVWHVPANIGALAANDTAVPWYPNDRTLHQAVKCAILELDAGSEASQVYEAEMAKLAAMVVDDRDFDGEQAGDNQWMQLDPSVFR